MQHCWFPTLTCCLWQWGLNLTARMCSCGFYRWVWEKVQTSLQAGPANAGCHHPDSFFTRSDSEAKVAQWYVYWEALDNRKGGGCRWNVTTIDKKKQQERTKKTWTGNLLSLHAQAHALLVTSGMKNSQQCTGRDGNHSFYKAHLNAWGRGSS